jgi:AcrR family transcriptional regulator
MTGDGQPGPAAGPAGEVIWLRPARAGAGRPAGHSRASITAAAVAIADSEGLAAVSMRRVAAALGTGAASLYRYVGTRDDLLDLMTDSVAAEYSLAPAGGDWLAGLVGIGEQARAIMGRHPWLPELVITRPVLGPNGLALLEHVLGLLAGHQAELTAKLEAFAMLSTLAATFAKHELAGGPQLQQRNSAYLRHVLAAGERPRLAALLATAPPAAGTGEGEAEDPYPGVLARVLTGLLAPG